jgi:hypothetical protein
VGAVDDPATVDERRLILDVLRQLGPLEIRLLKFITRPVPPPLPSGDPSPAWSLYEIEAADRSFAPALRTVVGRLSMLGVVMGPEGYIQLTGLGKELLTTLAAHAEEWRG